MTARHIVAIGGSDAGISAALRARELDPTTDVTVVVADAHPDFSICGISYYVSGEVTRLAYYPNSLKTQDNCRSSSDRGSLVHTRDRLVTRGRRRRPQCPAGPS